MKSKPARDTATLGDLLVANRDAAGLDLQDLSKASDLTVEQIHEVESGRHELDASELRALLASYQVPSVVNRLSRLAVEISLEEGCVTMTSTRRSWANQPDADQNLLSYLALLYAHHELELGESIPLKSVDLSLLRSALALRRPEVEAQLDRLDNSLPARIRRNKSLLAVAAAAGVAVVAGAITLIPGAQAPETAGNVPFPHDSGAIVATETIAEQPASAVDPQIDIGTALVIERSPEAASMHRDAARASEAAFVDPRIEIGTAAVIERSPLDVEPAD